MDESRESSVLRSGSSTVPSKLRFFNCTRRRVDVIWINHEGYGVRFRTLDPDKFVDMDTYVGHPWIFRDRETKEPMVVQSEEVYMPPAVVGRTHVNITIPLLSLTELSLRVLRRLIPNGSSDELHLPWLIKEELSKAASQPELTVTKNLTEYLTERRTGRINRFMRYLNPHLHWVNNPAPRPGLRLLRAVHPPVQNTGQANNAESSTTERSPVVSASDSHDAALDEESPDIVVATSEHLSDSQSTDGGTNEDSSDIVVDTSGPLSDIDDDTFYDHMDSVLNTYGHLPDADDARSPDPGASTIALLSDTDDDSSDFVIITSGNISEAEDYSDFGLSTSESDDTDEDSSDIVLSTSGHLSDSQDINDDIDEEESDNIISTFDHVSQVACNDTSVLVDDASPSQPRKRRSTHSECSPSKAARLEEGATCSNKAQNSSNNHNSNQQHSKEYLTRKELTIEDFLATDED